MSFVSHSPTFSIDNVTGVFLKDGKPFRYISGSLHYFRIPRIYWEDRLMKAKAAGLDAIQIYIPWNYHEPSPGKFVFDGDRDVVEFIELAQKNELLVLARVGPYICSEWDFGGIPAWLLSKDPNVKLRSSYAGFVLPAIRWFSQLLPKLQPLLYQNGGPIIMVQLENEYGSYYACDRDYLSALYDFSRFVLGNDIILYTTDGNSVAFLKCGSSDRRLFATVDFGIAGAQKPEVAFKDLEKFQPHHPLVNSEFYSGWFDDWGTKRHLVNATEFAEAAVSLWNYSDRVSFNIYMFHGGTNFGYWNGANSATDFIITSYDYDAPVSESGDITNKYLILRDVIHQLKHLDPPPLPPNISKASYGDVAVQFHSHLLYDLPVGVSSLRPLYMEALKQYQGFMAYTVHVGGKEGPGNVTFARVKDIGLVFTTDFFFETFVFHGFVSGAGSLNVTFSEDLPVLAIVTECRGHLNFGREMIGDIKGINGSVLLDGEELLNWVMKDVDFRSLNPIRFKQSNGGGSIDFPEPGRVYKGHFQIPSTPLDTFAVMNGFTRGVLSVNGYVVGRFYPSAGPQVSLYVPASMLLTGENVVTVLEFDHLTPSCRENSTQCFVTFRDSMVWLN
ncbi:unnamed protein product [Mesocestoides corti]|nr:unnamed protein product [Mesocestoides corti]